MSAPLPRSFPAGEVFAGWQARRAAGESADFEALCRAHPAHQEELRRLLAGERGGLLETAGRSLLLKELGERVPVRSRYRIEGELARGGMGAILKVFDSDLRRSLAMKVILDKDKGAPAGASPAVDERLLARFLEEAQVTGQLDHPGIVPVHELGLDSDGRLYFTMKLVKGRELSKIYELVFEQKEGWNETRALGVILKVCEALAYAHRKGVIHRDLKPANVMVGNFGEVYVMDWGVARVLGRADAHDIRIRPADASATSVETQRGAEREEMPDSPLMTMAGDVLGTPAYMPPEQARGEVEKLSPRSDVYAVGALLYHLLARQMPYVPPGARVSNHMILRWLLDAPPQPLSALRKDVPGALAAICERAMAREPEQRYADTLALAEDLRAYLEHRVVQAYQTGAFAELRKWVERNKGLSAASAAAVLALLAGLIVSSSLYVKAEEQKGRAERKADEVLRLSALQELDDLIAAADRLWTGYPENIEPHEKWLARAESLVGELPRHEEKLAELRTSARPWHEDELAAQRASHPRSAELESARNELASRRARTAALEARTPPREPTPEEAGVELASLPASPRALSDLAWTLVQPARTDFGGETKGLFVARRAVELARDRPASERAAIRNVLAWALLAAGRYDEAVLELERALEEAGPERAAEFHAQRDRLVQAIEEELAPEGQEEAAKRVQDLAQRVAGLESEVSPASMLTIDSSEDRWWHDQLAKLVDGLKEFSDPERGLFSSGVSAEHGWGMRKRLAFARTIRERSLDGAEAATSWAAALASIKDRGQCPAYDGLELAPQLGLLPLGQDPDSGLWEFAHLQSGEPAERDARGKLVLEEEMGLVFVLIPGGTFWMGAQSTEANGHNFDPQADVDEGPVHEVTLSAFFLSKFEMTQGQWLRFLGVNPSYSVKENYGSGFNAERRPWSALQPVEQVSWLECSAALAKLGLELPTEPQWEYAARAGTSTSWWCGNEKESLAGVANIADRYALEHGMASAVQYELWLDDGNTMQAEVGHYRANAFGLHEVLGNLREWCQGSFGIEVTPEGVERLVAGSRVRPGRGGSFIAPATQARSASRATGTPELQHGSIGLRPARRISAR